MPILGVIDSAKTNWLDPDVAFPIFYQVLSADTTSVTISNIPSTYSYLQLRVSGWTGRSAYIDPLNIRFNGDTGSNYSYQVLGGDAGTVKGESSSSTTALYCGRLAGSSGGGEMGVNVIDIYQYTNTNINKSALFLGGTEYRTDGVMLMGTGTWNNTSAISSITVFAGVGSMKTRTKITLYGYK